MKCAVLQTATAYTTNHYRRYRLFYCGYRYAVLRDRFGLLGDWVSVRGYRYYQVPA